MNQKNNNFEKNGPYESYHDNGQLWRIINYVDGKLHGQYESYYADGKLSYKGSYQNNQEVGFWLIGYSNGEIEKEFYL